ncbi:hypothetical protein PFLUV_G00037990 [Perca fluviatilis]|uniref:Uncharacterized protein n=1 Tax=Perca fluviatilis TaxID=8168 RepID=A0A6A5FPE3_PERFL|nr:hypothetical protein PFLUV_G00037990 [Perca fluviatilis]
MASGRYAGPLGCPARPCHGRKYIRLDRHLKALHDITKEDIKLFLEELRRKEIASQLSAIRGKKTTSRFRQPAPRLKEAQKKTLVCKST